MTLLVALLCALALPAASHASRNQLLTFEAPRDLLDPGKRDTALTQLDSLGVRSLRVVMYWRDVAPQPNSKEQPDVDTTDPATYDFSRVDPVLNAAKARGWPVLLTVSGPVPRWATRDRKDNVTRPNPDKFAQFMTAVGRHFKDRVALWAVWNEPNHPVFLAPQYDSRKRPVSPGLYRRLFLAAQRGLESAKVPDPRILMGETAPRGTGKDVAPLTFLRGALCLSASYRRTSQKCDRLKIAGFAHHAYTTRSGPYFVPPGRNDVTIGVLGRLVSALDKAARAKAIPARTPIYLTEFGIQSEPDPIFGVSFQRQAEYRAISERIAYDNKRVVSFSQYLLTDDAPRPGPKIARYSGFESGLITASGKAKPSLDAFRLSLVSSKRSKKTASIWGVVRPATVPGTAVLEYRAGAKGAFRTFKTVSFNRLGYFALTAPYKAGRQYRLVWTAPGGTVYRGAPTRTYRG
ncbi:MAG: hypothetical protein JWN65_2337 [Solirubrobacterales bacterium]|nr:hypothetical protein [Solirubrobacterales bacterium]